MRLGNYYGMFVEWLECLRGNASNQTEWRYLPLDPRGTCRVWGPVRLSVNDELQALFSIYIELSRLPSSGIVFFLPLSALVVGILVS